MKICLMMTMWLVILFGIADVTLAVDAEAQKELEAKILRKEINPKNLSQTFEYNSKTFKVSDFDAVVARHLEKVFLELDDIDEAKEYAKNYMTAKYYVIKSNTPSLERKTVMHNLDQMFRYIHGSKANEELTKMLECKEVEQLKPMKEILKKLEVSQEKEGCQSLNPGEHKIMKQNESFVAGDFLLKRKGDGNYQAALNIQFVNGKGSVSPEVMMKRAKECLSHASNSLKSPKGEKLEISIYSPEEMSKFPANQQTKNKVIKIEGPNFTSNSLNYSEKADCSEITHEVLHLLGLCDEYQDDKYPAWNCRIITKAPSLMRDRAMFDQAVPHKLSCECSSRECKNLMKSDDKELKLLYISKQTHERIPYKFRIKYCEIGEARSDRTKISNISQSTILKSNTENSFSVESKEVGSYNISPFYAMVYYTMTCTCPANDSKCLDEKKTILKDLNKPRVATVCPHFTKEKSKVPTSDATGADYRNNMITLTTAASLPSLLQPGHFNKIINGSCPGISANYNQCAGFAYKGKPCDVPAKCLDDKFYLGSEQ